VWQGCKEGRGGRWQCMVLIFITSAQQKMYLACTEITGSAMLSVSDIREE